VQAARARPHRSPVVEHHPSSQGRTLTDAISRRSLHLGATRTTAEPARCPSGWPGAPRSVTRFGNPTYGLRKRIGQRSGLGPSRSHRFPRDVDEDDDLSVQLLPAQCDAAVCCDAFRRTSGWLKGISVPPKHRLMPLRAIASGASVVGIGRIWVEGSPVFAPDWLDPGEGCVAVEPRSMAAALDAAEVTPGGGPSTNCMQTTGVWQDGQLTVTDTRWRQSVGRRGRGE
jgi:hypothetical protein